MRQWPRALGEGLCLLMLAALSPAASAQASADGKTLFGQHCAPCHQPDASGTIGLAPPLKGEHWARLGAARHYLPTVVTHGLSGPIQLGSLRFVGNMPAFAQLNDADLAAIVTHLRGLQGAGQDAPYTEAEIARVRALPGGPPQTRTLRQQLIGP
ncbi:MAG: hypothetical protein RIQ60_1480 [Pseudomonadota bacterium]|jgi:mono/diheme cytochrome c family protein